MRKKNVIIFLASVSLAVNAQNWSVNPFEHKVFIKNKGQFDFSNVSADRVEYAVSNEGVQIYFTKGGLTYERHEFVPMTEEEIEEMMENSELNEREEEEYEREKMVKRVPYYVHMDWIGANRNAEIIASEPVEYYFTYGDLSGKPAETNIRTSAYKKIVYKNLYPHIDLEYTFPEDKPGIKYTLTLHPGADVSSIKMKYSGTDGLFTDEEGNIKIKTPFGDITDHAPLSFYQNGEKILSGFRLSGSTVSFMLDKVALLNSSRQETIIIDPWTTMPTFTAYNAAYDVDYDYLGNVYAYGGGNHLLFQAIKFNIAGVIQWVYTTPIAFSLCEPLFAAIGCYGDFAVDPNSGTSYIVEGHHPNAGARVLKVDSSGVQVALDSVSNMSEMWRVVFDNVNKQLVIAGGGPETGTFNACVMDTNLTTVSALNILSTTLPEHDIGLLAVDNTNNCFMASVKSMADTLFDNWLLKCSADSLLPVSYTVYDNHKLSERNSVEYIGGGTPDGYAVGMNGMAVNNDHLYTYDGSAIKRWNKSTGALLDSASLYPAVYDTTGRIKVKWGGIAVDNCSHIYVGRVSSVLQLDTNFNVLSIIPPTNPTDTVYDVRIGPCKEIYTCGKYFVRATQLNSFCSSLNIFITSANTCTSTGSATAHATGGVGQYTYLWSPGGQTTTTITGLSPGTYTVMVTDSASICPNSVTATVTITQLPAMTTNISVTDANCGNSDGMAIVTVSTGTPPYTYNWSGGIGINDTAAGLPAGTYIVTVTDSNGCNQTDTAIVNNINGPVAALSQNNILCNGQCTGTALSNTTGGTAPYTYLWSNGATTQNIFNVCAGTYTFTVTDSAGCANTQAVTITQPSSIIVDTSTVAASCGAANGTATAGAVGGTPGYTYLWSNGQTTQTATGLAAGTYVVTVTDTNGCSKTQIVTITTTGGPTAAVTASLTTITAGQTSTLTATGGGTYLWSTNEITASIIVSPTIDSVYCVTVTDSACSDTACLKIFVNESEIPCPTNIDLSVPNAFSPNNDKINDDFCLEGWTACIKDFIVRIYDRWGEKVFESEDPAFCWDGTYKGKPMDAAVFVYYIEAELITSEEVVRKGNISLIR